MKKNTVKIKIIAAALFFALSMNSCGGEGGTETGNPQQPSSAPGNSDGADIEQESDNATANLARDGDITCRHTATDTRQNDSDYEEGTLLIVFKDFISENDVEIFSENYGLFFRDFFPALNAAKLEVLENELMEWICLLENDPSVREVRRIYTP